MLNSISRPAGALLLVLAGLLPARVAGQTTVGETGEKATPIKTGPVGTWKGPLSIPGGSVPIQIIISQGAGRLAATLDLPAKRLNRLPMSMAGHGDTLVLFAPAVDCHYDCVLTANGQELRGLWTQPGLRVPLTLSRFEAVAAPAESKTGPAPVTYHTEAVKLISQPSNVALGGTLSIPDGPGPFPAAVLLSDMGPHDRDARQGDYRFFALLAAALARQGIAVLRLDDRGVGESGGSGASATTADLVRDAQAALTFLRVRPSIDPARTGLIGHGEGGNVALLAAAQPLPPAFVVALAASGLVGQEMLASQAEPQSPADTARVGTARRQAQAAVKAQANKLRASGSNAAQVETYLAQQYLKQKSEERKQAETLLKFRRAMFEIVKQTTNEDQAQAIVTNMLRQRQPDLDPVQAREQAARFCTPWFRYYLKFDPQSDLANVRGPVLLLQGVNDAEVNAAINLPALEKGLRANKRVTVRRLLGVNHLLQTPASELVDGPNGRVDLVLSAQAVEAVRDWILLEAGK